MSCFAVGRREGKRTRRKISHIGRGEHSELSEEGDGTGKWDLNKNHEVFEGLGHIWGGWDALVEGLHSKSDESLGRISRPKRAVFRQGEP